VVDHPVRPAGPAAGGVGVVVGCSWSGGWFREWWRAGGCCTWFCVRGWPPGGVAGCWVCRLVGCRAGNGCGPLVVGVVRAGV